MLYPFVAPKTLLFRALGIIILAAFFYLALSGRELYWSRLRNKLSWIPAALLVVAYATSLLGVDFYHSFWSVYDRGDGCTLGNAAFLAGYLGMTLWATLAIAGGSRGFWRKMYYSGAALQFLAIVL